MITFPLSSQDFFAGLRPLDWTLYLPDNRVSEETQGGEVVDADLGVRLWTGTVSLGALEPRSARAIQAKVSLLQQAGRSFFAYPRDAAFPAYDPKGQILGASLPLIHALPNARELRLSGLPSGYQISAGDFLSFDYGTSPVRTALHQVVETVIASGAGVTPAFEVMPPVRPGAALGAQVRLVRPHCKAKIVPGSASVPRFDRNFGEAPSFDFVQTLR